MNGLRSNRDDMFEQIHELVTARVNDELTPEQFERLDTLLAENGEARRLYVRYVYETLALPSLLGVDDPSALSSDPLSGDGAEADDSLRIVVKQSASQRQFVGSPLFSYSTALLILCAMLLSAWAYKVTHYRQTAHDTHENVVPHYSQEMQFVGRITGMKDCRWTDPDTAPYGGSSVPLGRKYALNSGLLEITYGTGARVILEGPCVYEVDSHAGGYLARGKLAALVEKRVERREIVEKARVKASLLSPPSSLFCIHTPTAIVTDLGTEFGVEVAENGDTISHVFQGVIEMRPVGDNEKRTVLKADQSARVEIVDGIAHLVLGREAGAPPEFVRRILNLPKQLDVLDIVAGGNGTSCRRERGIDPTTGKQDTFFIPVQHRYENRFHRVAWNRLIDGVFIPDGRTEPVTLDSAGHTYGDLGELTEGLTIGCIWARAAEVSDHDQKRGKWNWIYSMGSDERFMPDRYGLLGFHSNLGITFDLQAMREIHVGTRPTRFRAITGIADASVAYPEPFGKADVWVFVDGRMKWTRKIQHDEAPVGIDVELGPNDRFLTLMSTNAGNGASCDWVVLGDPVLDMVSSDAKKQEK